MIIKEEENIDDIMLEERYAPISPRTTCPAVIFAASRKERVRGRTKVLNVSTITKKGFNHLGAPEGKREAVAV